jgi:hypothetical protein
MLSLEMRKKSRQTVWIALALLAVLVGLITMNLTVYLYLETMYTNLVSAAILSVLNLFAAGIFFMIASRQTTGAETEAIEEIRNFAWAQVQTDIDDVKQNVTQFTDSISKVKKSVDNFTSGDAFGLKKVMPIITTLIDLNKRK